jgi:cytochrome c oxidase subunit II
MNEKPLSHMCSGRFHAALGGSGCVGSPSFLTPHSAETVSVASLTWLMFAIGGIVPLVISVLLWIAYRRYRVQAGEKDPYAHDQVYLRNVAIGGGLAPIVVLLFFMSLGIQVENLSTAKRNKADIDIEVIGHQWWWEVRYANQNLQRRTRSIFQGDSQ